MTTLQSPPAAPAPGAAPREERRDAATVFVFVLAAIALIVSVVAVGFAMNDESGSGGAAAAEGGATTATASLTELKITPAALTVASGGTIHVSNDGATVHNFAIEGTDFRTAMLDGGGMEELKVTDLAPGTYKAFCEVPGHREAGMQADLTVTAAGAGAATASSDSAAAGTSGGSSSMRMGAEEMDKVMKAVVDKFPAKTEGTGGVDLAPKILADGTKEFDLTVSEIKWEVEPGKTVDAMAYNGIVPGPTIRVDPGDKVKVVVKNEMKESTAVHIHGVELPNAMDGVPDITQHPIKPGETFAYEFTTQSTPAVGMYHSHHNAQVQVPNGLAGAFLIGTVPTPAGVTIASEQTMMLNDAGTIGFSLNGKSFPATAPVAVKLGDWVLVHYLNEGVMSHPMHLHGMPQLVVAKDGFAVDKPYQADTINVAPGERYSVLVHATAPGVWAWHCHILPHAERSTGMFGMVTAMIVK